MPEKIVVLLFISIGLLQSCNTTEPPSPDKTITLTLEDASSIDAWINLTTSNLQLPISVTLNQSAVGGAQTSRTIDLVKADTLLYLDSLLPRTTYIFHASIQPSNHTNEVVSNVLVVATLDTTSHNFTWQSWTFGEHSSSVLRDIAIINENNIWAVGEIYMNDSLGQPDPHAYNAAHWDGNEWEIKKITVEFRGNLITPPLEGIFGFSGSDVWFVGSLPIHGDGTNWTMYDLRTMVDPGLSLSKAWGSSSDDMYFVGSAGSIAHYNGTNWQKIESGTTSIINDIWGINNDNNELILYCAVSSFFVPGDKKILRIKDNIVSPVSWDIDRRIYSVWAHSERFLFVCGEGAFEVKTGNWEEINIPLVSMTSIRGNDINDIFIVGGNGFKTHFNGVMWKTINTMNNYGYMEVSINGNTVAVCGRQQGYGLVEIGRRN